MRGLGAGLQQAKHPAAGHGVLVCATRVALCRAHGAVVRIVIETIWFGNVTMYLTGANLGQWALNARD